MSHDRWPQDLSTTGGQPAATGDGPRLRWNGALGTVGSASPALRLFDVRLDPIGPRATVPHYYHAFGLIGATFRELGWKTPIFFEGAVPISPNARRCNHEGRWLAPIKVRLDPSERVDLAARRPDLVAALRARLDAAAAEAVRPPHSRAA